MDIVLVNESGQRLTKLDEIITGKRSILRPKLSSFESPEKVSPRKYSFLERQKVKAVNYASSKIQVGDKIGASSSIISIRNRSQTSDKATRETTNFECSSKI